MRVVFHFFGQQRRDGCTAGVVDTFGDCNHAAAMALVHGFDIEQKLVQVKGPFRQVNQVWTVVREFFAQGRRRCQKTGMAPPIPTPTYTPGRAPLSRLAPANACATKRAADGKPGVWSLPTRSLSMVLGM